MKVSQIENSNKKNSHLKQEKQIQKYLEYDDDVFQDIYKIKGYTSIFEANQVVDQILDQGAAHLYSTYIDEKIPNHVLNEVMGLINCQLSSYFITMDKTYNNLTLEEESAVQKKYYDTFCPFAQKFKKEDPSEVKFLEIEGIQQVFPRDNSKPSLEKRQQLIIENQKQLEIPKQLPFLPIQGQQISQKEAQFIQFENEMRKVYTVQIRQKKLKNEELKVQQKNDQAMDLIRKKKLAELSQKTYTYDYNGNIIFKQENKNSVSYNLLEYVEHNVQTTQNNPEKEIKFNVHTQVEPSIKNFQDHYITKKVVTAQQKWKVPDESYNNNGSRQTSMIPLIQINQGVKLTEFQKEEPVILQGKTFLNDFKYLKKQEYIKEKEYGRYDSGIVKQIQDQHRQNTAQKQKESQQQLLLDQKENQKNINNVNNKINTGDVKQFRSNSNAELQKNQLSQASITKKSQFKVRKARAATSHSKNNNIKLPLSDMKIVASTVQSQILKKPQSIKSINNNGNENIIINNVNILDQMLY